MTARILDGKAAAAAVKDDLRARVKALAERGLVPGLGTILVGDDPGSRAYVEGKHRDCAEVGIASIRRDLPADAVRLHARLWIAWPGLRRAWRNGAVERASAEAWEHRLAPVPVNAAPTRGEHATALRRPAGLRLRAWSTARRGTSAA